MFIVLADIHGCITNLKTVLDKYSQQPIKGIIVLGDILNHGPRNPMVDEYSPLKCATLLNAFATQVIAVRGNCDSEVDQMLLNFPMMSDMAIVYLKDRRIVLSHGHLYSDDASDDFFSDGDVYLFGHSHLPKAEYSKQRYLLNPGSITLAKGGFEQSYGILDADGFAVYNLNHQRIIGIEFG
ncbi:phosphodiesterase [Thalassotalea sp. Y01]|uniref:phosphodiesterase n=1 Tax=Thalassotalea sp. Y01 TaxID=2729613 RepID=UPI00145DCF4B|nr:phosphodiesterase [Thalassotalea sp. Y01]NMP15901.1 phosphodiesterase [Thalassotalea sp. Y01]